MATKLIDLIESVNADDLPTNEFTIEDKDPMVILGKLNEVIAYLQTLQATINSSDSKANEALQKAIQAVADATQALSVANGIDDKATQALANAIEAVSTANTALSASNTALSTANTAISTANTALSSANNAVETAGNALGTAESAETKADTAITTANGAKTTAEGIDNKATTALSNSQTAVSTANTADTKATQALATANTANDTANTANDTANTANDTANTALTNSSNALTTSDEANTKATQALATANTADATANNANNSATGAFSKASIAVTTANEAKATAEDALGQVVAGLGTKVYRDSQLLGTLDIKPIEDDIANNATAINNEATTRANAVNALENNKADKSAIPTKTSQLTNDSSFATTSQIPTKTSQLTNDSNFATTSQIPSITQSTGTSTTSVMSQKATTDELTAITTALSNKFSNHPQSTYDCNACYDEGVYLIANGSNCPSGSQYGSLFVMPYRKPTGNTKPDYCVQIYLPNGDDSTSPNSMFYRTSLENSWTAWQEVATTSQIPDVSVYAKKDLSNVTYPANTKGSTTTGSGDRVVETYISSDGRTWYRKWASGWKECGGYSPVALSSYKKTIVLPNITFSNTNYTIVITPENGGTGEDNYSWWLENSTSTSKFEVRMRVNISTIRYYCCGY